MGISILFRFWKMFNLMNYLCIGKRAHIDAYVVGSLFALLIFETGNNAKYTKRYIYKYI